MSGLTSRSLARHRRHERPPLDVDAPHYVYRVYDEHDLLLYVGCSINVDNRLANHRSAAPWYRFMARHTVVEEPNRRAALDLERLTIESETPFFNSSVANMEATKANLRAAQQSMREAGDSRPVWLDDTLDADTEEALYEEWRTRLEAERGRLRDRYPYTTDADRMASYLTARALRGSVEPPVDLAVPPTLRMVANILEHVETFFAEAGYPLTDDQQRVLRDAVGTARQQSDELKAAS